MPRKSTENFISVADRKQELINKLNWCVYAVRTGVVTEDEYQALLTLAKIIDTTYETHKERQEIAKRESTYKESSKEGEFENTKSSGRIAKIIGPDSKKSGKSK
jgi:hypothetical protein